MIAWAIETLVATTALMVLVLVIRAPVRRAFGPAIAYALWLMPVVRLAMPPLPGEWQLSRLLAPLAKSAEAAPAITAGVLNADKIPVEASQAALWQMDVEGARMALVPPTAVADGMNLILLLALLWAAGTAVFLGYHLIAHSRFCGRLLRAARIDRTVADGRVRVIETDAAHGPLAFGIWRKYVAFPRDFSERYDEVERDLALAHELGHHVRGDLIANWVALVVLALHWFNPIAWRAFRAFRADQEMACDALVLAGRAEALRHAYGRAIVKSAHGGAVSAACHLHTINELKGRLKMLSKTRKSSPTRIAAGIAGVGALSLAALGLTASGTQAAERIRSKVEAATGVSFSVQEAPEAPEAPEAIEPAKAPKAPGTKRTTRITVQDGDAPAVTLEGDEAEAAIARGYVETKGEKPGETRKVYIARAPLPPLPPVSPIASVPPMPAVAPLPPVPEVRDGKCGGRVDGPMIEHKKDGTKRVMIVCTDRIEYMADFAAKNAERHARLGLEQARMGLKMARAQIADSKEMDQVSQAAALAGIDEAMQELNSKDID